MTEFKEALTRQYGKPHLAMDAEVNMSRIKHTSSVAKMREEFEACFVHLDKTEQDKKHLFWLRLKEEFARQMLTHSLSAEQSYPPGTTNSTGLSIGETYEEYVEKLIEWDQRYFNLKRMHATNTSRPSHPYTPRAPTQAPPTTTTYTAQRQTPTAGPSRPRNPDDMDIDTLRKEGRCFHCKEKGHRASNCPKKAREQKARAQDIDGLEEMVARMTNMKLQEIRESGENGRERVLAVPQDNATNPGF